MLRKIIWWTLRKQCGGADCATGSGMLVRGSHVCVGGGYSEEFEVKVGVHQGSVLSPLLYIIVFEALSLVMGIGQKNHNRLSGK